MSYWLHVFTTCVLYCRHDGLHLHDAHKQGKRITIEGANATMLEMAHGTHLHDFSPDVVNTCRTRSCVTSSPNAK
jgi:adenylosuccinate synthase